MILPDYPQEGIPLKAQWGRQVVDALRALRVRAGRGLRKVSEDSSGSVLESITQPGAQVQAAITFSGTAYIAGNKITGLGTKTWVRCYLDRATAEDTDDSPPDPFPINEEWYEVSKTSGDIHIIRA